MMRICVAIAERSSNLFRARAWRKEGVGGEGIFARPRFPIPIFSSPPNFVPVKLARRLKFV